MVSPSEQQPGAAGAEDAAAFGCSGWPRVRLLERVQLAVRRGIAEQRAHPCNEQELELDVLQHFLSLMV